jgi:hypothetical protein
MTYIPKINTKYPKLTTEQIQSHLIERKAKQAGKTIPTFQHVVRNASADEYIPVCKYNRIYHKSTRIAYNIPDGLDCIY